MYHESTITFWQMLKAMGVVSAFVVFLLSPQLSKTAKLEWQKYQTQKAEKALAKKAKSVKEGSISLASLDKVKNEAN